MRIEMVTDTFAPDVNGVAMTLGRLVEGLRGRGHRVHVIHTAAEVSAGETRAAAMKLPGYKEVRVGLSKPFELRARWMKRRPDVVYVATESPLGVSAIKAARASGILVVAGFHTNFHDYMEHYRMHALQFMAMAYLRRFHDRADCTLVPSTDVAARLHAAGFENIHQLGRGVDADLFSPEKRSAELRAEWSIRPGAPVAVLVGRVAPEKNLGLAIEAFKQMRLAVPDARCVIVGDGPSRAPLEREHPWIHFAGMRTGEDLAAHYASADVLIFPSETETFGNVLLEGMASGLATVSYDYAASGLHVRHGKNGLKAAKGNASDFARLAVEALVIRPDDDLRRAARETALQSGWDQVLDDLESLFTDLAGKARRPAAVSTKPGKRPKLVCRTVFLSDLHLGTPDSKADEVVTFLKHIRCGKLVLNGDIIDGWALQRGSRWTSRHSRVIRKILKMTERDKTEVVYLRGNHDEILDRFMPFAFGRVRMMKEHIHLTAEGKRYLIVHGDGFDSISTNHKWLAVLGAVGYDFLLRVNRLYNRWRAWRGMEYYSISKTVKARVKSAVCFVDRYQVLLQNLARHRKCEGIICGHIHTPEDEFAGGIHYLNCGDWVESLTAVIEHNDGRMELVQYRDFMHRMTTAEPESADSRAFC